MSSSQSKFAGKRKSKTAAKFAPTDEQQANIDAFKQGNNIATEALAGTGKTSTTVLMADEAGPEEKLLYGAFNTTIAREAIDKFLPNVQCRTLHSLAFGSIGKNYKPRLDEKTRISAKQVAGLLGIRDNFVVDEKTGISLPPRKLARLSLETVQRFCYSGDMEIGPQHVPYVKTATYEAMDELRPYLVPFAKKAWTDIKQDNGRLRFQHDYYLKMFQIWLRESGKKLPFDVIFFDEAQDANPCNSAMILDQNHAQLIAVGDRNQQIYGWRGAEDAIQSWPADVHLYLTKSFRFGPAIAEEANKWLELLEAPIRVEGFEKIDSTIANLTLPEADAVLCRTNAGVLSMAVQAITEHNLSIHIVGGTNEIMMFTEAARDLIANDGLPQSERFDVAHPDLIGFDTWTDVKKFITEEGDADLEKLVKLVDDHGIDKLMQICKTTTAKEADAQVCLSTAHKAKGREWGSVLIGDDFQEPAPDPETGETKDNRSESMLAYVAVTRAMKKLDPGTLNWVNNHLKRKDLDIGKPMTDEDMDKAYGS